MCLFLANQTLPHSFDHISVSSPPFPDIFGASYSHFDSLFYPSYCFALFDFEPTCPFQASQTLPHSTCNNSVISDSNFDVFGMLNYCYHLLFIDPISGPTNILNIEFLCNTPVIPWIPTISCSCISVISNLLAYLLSCITVVNVAGLHEPPG
jgi:hypothetical protein